MRFETLLAIVGDLPVFETGLLLAGDVSRGDVQRQLSRWKRAGKVVQVRRGLYALAPPYRRIDPHPFLVANRLVRGSYVSLESALAYHGLIPEGVPVTSSVTTGRPGRRATALGRYDFQCIQRRLFRGFDSIEVARAQPAFVARPHKALLDLAYLRPHGRGGAWIEELRLQNLDSLDLVAFREEAAHAGVPRLDRLLVHLERLAAEEHADYEVL